MCFIESFEATEAKERQNRPGIAPVLGLPAEQPRLTMGSRLGAFEKSIAATSQQDNSNPATPTAASAVSAAIFKPSETSNSPPESLSEKDTEAKATGLSFYFSKNKKSE